MTRDQGLQDLLARAAGEVRADPEHALDQVIAGARRRTRRTRVLVAAVAAVIALLTAAGISSVHGRLLGQQEPPVTRQPTDVGPSRLPLGSSSSPLTGEWQTRATDLSLVRSRLRAAGVDRAVADQVLGSDAQWVVQMTFSVRLTVTTWDPRHPTSSLRVDDSYVWRALSGQRIAISAVGGARPVILSYHLTGQELRLVIERTPSGDTAPSARLRAWIASPLRLVR